MTTGCGNPQSHEKGPEMKRYEITGIPLCPPFDILAGRSVGTVFDADLDEALEHRLVGEGALRVLPSPKAETAKTGHGHGAKHEPSS